MPTNQKALTVAAHPGDGAVLLAFSLNLSGSWVIISFAQRCSRLAK